ncbi:MAG: LysM peptidoglycan-binding domain-containing protein [Chthoniobacterales bacterium]
MTRLFLLLLLAPCFSCSRMMSPRGTQAVKDADARAADGDFLQAISLYESALDGSARTAEIHYKLALLYDDKMNDPLSALHHFKRYLTVAPGGSRAEEVKNFMKRDELAIVTTLSGDAVVSRSEAARLRNENLNLRKEIDEQRAQARSTAASEKAAGKSAKAVSQGKKPKSPARTHVVEPGDTLLSLSRKFYNSPDRWKEILEANPGSIEDPGKLKIGQSLIIP